MTIHIRNLQAEDIPLLQGVDTGIEEDYVLRIAGGLMEGNNRMYGLFTGDTLVSFGGYSIYAGRYAMLGRLRSDRRFKKNGYATQLMQHIRDAAFHDPQIKWVGANTQEDNVSARRVLEKLDLEPLTTLHGATTDDVGELDKGAPAWKTITDTSRKREWLMQTYVWNQLIFPYECYYVFPSSHALFPDEVISTWNFYENDDQTRFVITKKDRKKHHYLQMAYPWDDIFDQPGLWAAASLDYDMLKKETNAETYIWYDMTKNQVQSLPSDHHWHLASPWILHGIDKTTWKNKFTSGTLKYTTTW